MEDISRDREEEKDRPPEEEKKPDKERKIRYETLPDISYQTYSENIQKDMDIIFNPPFLNRDGIKFNHSKKEIKNIRRYLLDKTLSRGIPAKFNSSTSSSDVFKNTILEKDRKKISSIIYVKYKGRTAFSYNTSRDSISERFREVDKEAYNKLKSDLEREIIEFKGDTFAGQVTAKFEQFTDRPDPTSQVWRPTYRDVDDAQKEITEKMRMEFESQKYDLESNLRQEEDRRRRAEENYERSLQSKKEYSERIYKEIKEKEERIQVLENQLRTQNFSQFDKNEKSREIQELKAEISRLENERDDLRQKIKYLEKDLDSQQGSINDLQKQVNEKQKRIEKLEKKGVSSSDLQSKNREITQLKKEKDDLEKQLQAQKQRTKLVQEHRDKWKKHSDKDSASLAASEEKVLSLTKEVDDLNNSIEALRKVNSSKVKEFEDYKVDAEKRLNKAREEYIQEKAELENAYKKEKADLESAINILNNEKEEGLSKNEIDSLKSLLESKDITIQNLEDEAFRLRDLNLSLKTIEEGNKEEYDRKLKEIKDQKDRVEQSKNTLEERLRKYTQKLEDKEAENKRLKGAIDSYLSQLEELNKKASKDKKLFIANQNEFTKVQEENKNLKRNVLQLQREKKASEQREKTLEGNIVHQQERIEAKDKENTEYQEKFKVFSQEKKEFNRKEKTFQQNIKDKEEKIRQKNVTISRQREDLQELRERKERIEYTLERERFNRQQYDRKTAEYNALVESAQRQIDQGVRDKFQLEEELKESQKQIQEYQKKFIDPKEHENMVRDNKDLIKTIDFLEKNEKQTAKIVVQLHNEKADIERKYKKEKESYERDRQNFENYEKKVNQKEKVNQEKYKKDIQKIRDNYSKQERKLQEILEKERESHKFQLSQRLRPGDIKSVQILLNNLSLDDLDEENYRDAYIKYKTARDNFAKKADDETSSRVQRLMFEELKKLADIRLDLLNMSFNRSAKTEAGKEFIRRTDQTLAGKFYRFRMRVSKYLAGTTLGAGIMGVFYLVYDLIKAAISKTVVPIATHGKQIATKIGQAAYNSRRSTKAILIGGTAAFVDKAKKDGFINTLYNWINNLYYGVEYTLEAGARGMEMGLNAAETIVSTSADVAKYVANNTSTVFLMIISAIGIIITLQYSREK